MHLVSSRSYQFKSAVADKALLFHPFYPRSEEHEPELVRIRPHAVYASCGRTQSSL